MDPIESPWCLDLALDPLDVRRARRLAAAFARHEHLDDMTDSLVLITSELVSNALRYAESMISVTLSHRDATILVEVADDGDGGPEMQHPDALTAWGRGLQIVDGLADDWGSRRVDPGKVVWAELAAVG